MSQNYFAHRLTQEILKKQSRLVVGMDPVWDRLPEPLRNKDVEEALGEYCKGVFQAVAPFAAAVKPQIAFFEQFGWRGLRAYEKCCQIAKEYSLLVIADAKRGDIGSTATAYAKAFLEDNEKGIGRFVDALTVNPYLGMDSLEPFKKACEDNGKGLFILARTSNPGASDFQDRISDGKTLYHAVAEEVQAWSASDKEAQNAEQGNYSSWGLVSGATYPKQLEEIRSTAPQSYLLLPGLGAQGGKASELAVSFDRQGLGALASASRSILYAYEKESELNWLEAIALAAKETRDEIEEARAQ